MIRLKLLHISPHLGGGVGSVILNWTKNDVSRNMHTVLSLDKNKNQEWRNIHQGYSKINISDNCNSKTNFKTLLNQKIKQSDIVIIHWWNHPLLYNLMVNEMFPPCRLIIWNHISGLYPPYTIPYKVIDFADNFVHTSPVSYESNALKNLSIDQKAKMEVIWSTSGLEGYEALQRIPQKIFRIGFIGTTDFAKLHPQFINMCANVERDHVQFVVCSQDCQQHLIAQASTTKIFEKFLFKGKQNPKNELPTYAIFGCPLQPNHFGTCEQALGEAMMAGCVPVVLDNPAERYIVEHMKTGIIAKSTEDYSRSIEYLYDNPDILEKLSFNARVAAKEKYDIKRTISQWTHLFESMMKLPKRKRAWDISGYKRTPSQLYAESLGTYGEILHEYITSKTDMEKEKMKEQIRKLFQSNLMFSSKSKGSVLQYLTFFPEDEILQEWSSLIEHTSTESSIYG